MPKGRLARAGPVAMANKIAWRRGEAYRLPVRP